MKKALLLAAATLALSACNTEIGDGDGADVNVSAEGRSEDNRMSISAPGFNMKIDLPESVRREANLDSDDALFYPGAKLAGMHIQANDGGGVELRFTTPDAIEKVRAWYEDAARTEFRIGNAEGVGATVRLSGIAGDNEAPFDLTLSPDGTGTEGVLSLSERN